MSNRMLLLPALLFASLFTGGAQSASQSSASDVTATSDQASREPKQSLRQAEAPVAGLVRLDKNTLALSLAKQKLLLYDFEFNGDTVATDKLHLKQLGPDVYEITSIAYTVGEWRVRIRDATNYYGLGERFDTLNHARTVVHNLLQQGQGSSAARGSSSSKPVPFFMSTTGYGVWFEITGDATFDMNATSRTDVVVDCDAEKLRVVLFTGPEFPKILEHFTALAGRSVLPPYWAFAPWLGLKDESYARFVEKIDRARSLNLPSSVVISEAAVPGAETVKHLHDAGYKLLVPEAPLIGSKAPGYAEADASGFFVKSSDGTPFLEDAGNGAEPAIDFTSPRAKLWWQDRAREAIHAGADGFTDDGFSTNFVGDVKFNDESDPRVMRNRYAALYANAMEELIVKDLKGNGCLSLRGATAGANGLGFPMGEDTESSFGTENGLSSVVTAGLNAGLSGMPLWIAGVGGERKSANDPDPEFFMRWTEFAAFSPVMTTSSNGRISPWEDGDKIVGDRALDVYRKFSTLHMSLFPYRYAAAQQAAKTGMPIMRALVLAYQDDEQARQARDEYLFGPDLLVAPIVDQATQRTVYLPRGEWLDYWTGKMFRGGRTIVADAAIDSIPLFVRQGAVLPRIPAEVMTLVPSAESGNKAVKTMDDRRVYELFGSGESESVDFEGRTLSRSANALKITGDAAARMILRWRFQKVAEVTVNGAPVKQQANAFGPFVEFDYLKQADVRWR